MSEGHPIIWGRQTAMAALPITCHLNCSGTLTRTVSASRRECARASIDERVELASAEAKGVPSATVQNGSDKLEIRRVINGMWQTSGGWGKIGSQAAVDAMLRHADAGFTTFDMADIYGPAEELYGMFINKVRQERGEEISLCIKGLTKWVPRPMKMTRSYVEGSIDRSRKRMDVNTLDMLQFHWWDYSDDGYLDALRHLTDLKEEGKIKTLALTNFDTTRLNIILDNQIPIVSNQVQYSVVDIRPQKRMAELCRLSGVKLITYGSVMGGLLSEKFLGANLSVPFMGPSLNTPSLSKYKQVVDQWGGWDLFQELLQTLKRISTKHGVSIPAVAVKYVLSQAWWPWIEDGIYVKTWYQSIMDGIVAMT